MTGKKNGDDSSAWTQQVGQLSPEGGSSASWQQVSLVWSCGQAPLGGPLEEHLLDRPLTGPIRVDVLLTPDGSASLPTPF